ncbi:tripartite tricarboxylate transporter substrate binding protein [Roseomonas hellenica]|uniref:Tripartite tricarboxylate transporter substrate binding protein n=1 Tax=Plastoroseomonas hellenica TaxID=2687306 RepID=A0ABS5F630_9PROT|nr:tripartite tricarboxylate transporter substrate binding protein [Plastoroseomonas hellenica]MBR0668020.1 tripartite tricarboxylate transporter substrate binding protein [Plastoroseomonas hellenica]
MRQSLPRRCRSGAVRLLGLAIAASFAPLAVQAQPTYPDRSIRLIVATAAGGASDILARQVGQKLTEAWGQPVVVDPRPGANGNIAAVAAARAPADGYTLMMGTIGVMAVNVSIYRDAGYDPARDFDPVARLVRFSNILVVHPSNPARTMQEFILQTRERPGRATYGSPGNGGSPHLAMVVFARMAGLEMEHVPYRGAAPALSDLIAGNLVAAFSDPLVTLPQVADGRVRALAVSGPQRLAAAPTIPTVAEAGLPGYDVTGWLGIVAPRGVPAPIVARLNAELNRIIREPEMVARLASQGAEVTTGTPEEFGAYMRGEIARWAQVTREAGIRAE